MNLTVTRRVRSLERCRFPFTPMNKTQLVAQVQKRLGASTSKAMAERATDTVLAAEKRG